MYMTLCILSSPCDQDEHHKIITQSLQTTIATSETFKNFIATQLR